jgi:serine/threonine protein kinase/formylglycine-generating enzyme required for sulfatase activity
LGEADEEGLLAHLERCAACAGKLKALGEPDALVGLLRKAHASGEVAASGPIARLIERLSKLRPGDTSAVARDETPPPPEPVSSRSTVPGAAPASSQPPPMEIYDFLAPPEASDELGRLGPYRVLKVLGSGGMGVVFRAEDPHLARHVALKAMLPTLAASTSARRRFLREARAAAALKHDHIVTIHQVGEDHGVPFLAMEFLDGEPLDARLERQGKLPVAEVLRIGREIALALAAAHQRGLIHRDIKPANIWLETQPGEPAASATEEHGEPAASATGRCSEPGASAIGGPATGGRVKILDFGLARPAGEGGQLTQQGAIVGTPAYMAPEQARGKHLDGRCDLFSLGCVLYRLATGAPAFRGGDMVSTLMAVAIEEPAPPVSLDLELPAELSDLVMQLLAKEPAQRPASAKAVAESLREIEKRLLPATRGSAPAHQPDRSGKKRRPVAWLVGMAGGFLAAVIAALVLFWPTPRGMVKIESNDPAIKIVFDKTGPTVTGADKQPITLRAGEHGILVKRGDFQFETDRLVIKKGKTTTLKVELLKGKIQVTADGKVIGMGKVPSVSRVDEGSRAGEERDANALKMKFCWCPTRTIPGPRRSPGIHAQGFHIPGFWMGKYEVTQSEWARVMGSMPSHALDKGKGDRHPIYYVSHDDATDFCRKLTDRERKAGKLPRGWAYRLPTDTQWEYACRAGTTTATAFGDKLDSTQANFNGDWPFNGAPKGPNRGKAMKVGSFHPNAWGICDMHGNVGEYTAIPGRHRGGSWYDSGRNCCSAISIPDLPDASEHVGFRVALVPPED